LPLEHFAGSSEATSQAQQGSRTPRATSRTPSLGADQSPSSETSVPRASIDLAPRPLTANVETSSANGQATTFGPSPCRETSKRRPTAPESLSRFRQNATVLYLCQKLRSLEGASQPAAAV
jgi:hypothetical protein